MGSKLKTKKIKLEAPILARIQAEQWTSPGPVWDERESLVVIPADDYVVFKKEIEAKGESKAWTCFEAHFMAEGVKDPIKIRYRSGEEPDDTADLNIAAFKALRNWPSDANPKIKTNQDAIFAING